MWEVHSARPVTEGDICYGPVCLVVVFVSDTIIECDYAQPSSRRGSFRTGELGEERKREEESTTPASAPTTSIAGESSGQPHQHLAQGGVAIANLPQVTTAQKFPVCI